MLNQSTQQPKTRLDDYFGLKPTKDIAKELMAKVEEYYQHLQTTGRFTLWRRVYNAYYRGEQRGGRMRKAGRQNEYTLIFVNHFRNLLKHLCNQVTSQKPTPEPQAVNTDYDSQSQTITARGILDYYDRYADVEGYIERAVESAALYGEGYVSMTFDTSIGEDYLPDQNGSMIKTGDIVFQSHTPLEIVRDISLSLSQKHDWKIVRRFVNKYDYAAKYPQYADKIISIDPDKENLWKTSFEMVKAQSSSIPIFTFYHDRTSILPNGRQVDFLDNDIVPFDGPLAYKKFPVYEIVPDVKEGLAFGYTTAYDLLPLQDAYDSLSSIIVTNQSNFGVQNIAVPKGSNLSVSQITDGLNLIEYDAKLGGEPKGLNLTATPAEIFNYLDKLENLMETIIGINSVVRGNPEASLKSGAALALVASQSIQFNSSFQRSYAKFLSSMWSGIIEILQSYASLPRLMMIAGKSNRSAMRSFTNKDISNISRVVVNMGNPLSRTTAGKLQIADTLLNTGLIKTPEEYISVLNSGRLEPLTENADAQLRLIRNENENLMDGKPVQAVLTDDHILHIREHQTVLSSTESRANPQILQASLNHIQQHINILMSGHPLLALLGQPNLAPPVPAGNQPNGNAAAVNNPTPPQQQLAEKVKPAGQPNNPMTGKQYNPMTGGL